MQYISKSRKNHQCSKCGQTIYIGESYYRNGKYSYCDMCAGYKSSGKIRKNTNTLEYQPSVFEYKICSVLMRILAVIVFLIGLPFIPIGFIITSLISYFMWSTANEWKKLSKNIISSKEKIQTPDIKPLNNLENNVNQYNKVKTISANFEFPLFVDDSILKYQYNDIFVMGSKYRNIDYTKINIRELVYFEEDLTNEYDKNAIKIICNNQFIGYVPQNNIQKMIKDYLNEDECFLFAFISKIDENNQLIDISIGFYKKYTEKDLLKYDKIDAMLIKTSKKDISGNYRYETVELLSIGDLVTIEFQEDTNSYIVFDEYYNELGELGVNVSKQILEKEQNYSFHAFVKEIKQTSSNRLNVNISIYFINK